ncbi:MAG: hypothetical protein AAGA55_07005 [Planctomycetota bacterium]
MSKRAGPPLFELLRERGESPINVEPGSRQPAGDTEPVASRAETPARSASSSAPSARESDSGIPWSGGGVTRAERSAATFEDEPVQSGEFRVSATRLYLCVAIALVLIVGAWAAGYRLGQREATRQLAASVRDESVVVPPRGAGVQEPEEQQIEAPAGGPADAGASERSPPLASEARPAALPADWVLLADRLRAGDPRIPGTNYLELATLPREQAEDALNFLAGRGVRAIGVPVDSRARADNNPSRYTLYSLGLAVPSGQYSSTTSERRDHERLVAAIGADWMRDRRGGSNFSQTLWRRYDP